MSRPALPTFAVVLTVSVSVSVAQLACASAPPPAQPPAPAVAISAPPPPAAPPAPAGPPVAMIDGQPISAAAFDAHLAATGLPRALALDDLVDLTLLRAAAAAQGIPLAPGAPTGEARAAAELALAGKLAVTLPPPADMLVVDHAWVKDAPKGPKAKSITAAQKKSLEALRGRVLAGQSLPEAFKTLPGVDGEAWHIGDHEEYPYGVVPAAAHDLPPGSVSPIIAGDGGLHLFKLYARKTVPPAPDVVHRELRDKLREGRAIELAPTP